MPRWRRSVRAAAIGTSVGVGVTGTLLLSLWQVQEQLQRSTDGRQTEIRQLLGDSSRELLEVAGTCARVGAHTLGHVEQLHALDGSNALSASEQATVGRLLERLRAQCAGTDTVPQAKCDEPGRTHQKELCEVALKDHSSSSGGGGGALSYWHPFPQSPDAFHNLAQVWAWLRTPPRHHDSAVALAPQASVTAAAPAVNNPMPANSVPMRPAPAPAPADGSSAPGNSDGDATSEEWVSAIDPAEAAQLQADCSEKTRLYTQIYSESARPRAEQLRARLQEARAGRLRIAPIENVLRTAALRQQRPPVPWQQPTLIFHKAELKTCAKALAQVVQVRWAMPGNEKARATGLPAGLTGQPHTIELWLPTMPPERTGTR